MLQPTESVKEVYDPAEIQVILMGLNDAEYTKLNKVVRARAEVFGYDTDELLNQVVEKILSGDRKWPKGISVYQLFSMISRSILSNHFNKVSTELSLDAMVDDFGEGNEATKRLSQIETEKNSLDNKKALVYRAVSDDQVATDIIMLKMDGCKKGEIVDCLEISDTEYESKMRKIRRRIEKATKEVNYE